MTPDLSIVVPVFNEVDNVGPLTDAVREALVGTGEQSWELVFVDDASKDATRARVLEIAKEDPRVRLVALARNYGQTAAMQAGFDQSRGRVVVSMDGDLQNDPADIPQLVEKLREGYDLVAGYRVRRKDAVIVRKIPSWVANRLIRFLTGVQIRDSGCSLKAYRRETLQRMRLYADMHRFIPHVAAATAGARIAEIPVRHHARRFGESKYGLSRVFKVAADLITITVIRSSRERPLVLFAGGALVSATLGVVFALASVVAYSSFRAEKAASFVFPGVSLLWFGLGGYLILLGLMLEVALWKMQRHDPQLVPLAHEWRGRPAGGGPS
jgi:glycosyltransferase involved in cell wall biosynthesis